MKNIVKLFFSLFLLGALASCEKKIAEVTVEGGTPPSLTANKTAISIAFATKDDEAITLKWTNPNYMFSTGLSSQDVSYLVEIDTTGSNFTNPNRKTIGLSKDLSLTLSQGTLNDYLLNQLVLVAGMSHNIEMRVIASLKNNAIPLTSNTLKFAVTPYAIPPKVTPPTTGKLYIVGNATNGGWNNPVPVPTQEFTKVSPTLYEITVTITGGNSFLLLPLNGDWGVKYGGVGANNTNNPGGDDIKLNGGDLLAPAVSGNYKLQVDFQRGKYTMTKL